MKPTIETNDAAYDVDDIIQLERENTKLKARTARLEKYLQFLVNNDSINDCSIEKEVVQLLNETPQQSLVEIQADAVKNSFEKKVHDVLFKHIDRLNDPCPDVDPLERIVTSLISDFDVVWQPELDRLRNSVKDGSDG